MHSFFTIGILLLQYALLKIGQAPVWLIKVTVDRLQWTVRKILSFHLPAYQLKLPKIQLPAVKLPSPNLPKSPDIHLQLPKISFPKFNLQLPSLPRIHHRRGRPHKSWFLPRYVASVKLFLRKRVPKKVRIITIAGLILVALYSYTSFIFTAAYQLPSPEKLTSTNKALTTEFFDRNGKLLYRLYEGRNRTLVKLNELPIFVGKATIAAEDKNFYSHPGIDIVAILRASFNNLINHPKVSQLEGASTITQQLIKNTLLTPEKTYIRKIKEIVLALWTERMYSKDQILQMYLNEAPYGGPAWGIEAAAQTYFGISAKNLSLAQAAYLAGLPASPTQFSPYSATPSLGKQRQKEVLNRMVEDKFLNPAEETKALSTDLHLKPQTADIKAPHFVMYIKDLLSQKYGQRVVSQGGLKITTTLDSGIQDLAEKSVSGELENLSSLNVQNGATMVTDAKTGQILAMVGSKDYHELKFGSFNVATAARQPGSSIKVITYATAFKQGFSPGTTILDAPVSFKDGIYTYSPVNYDGHFHGPVSIRQALGSSYNIPAVKMLSTVGIDNMIQTAKDMGITTFDDRSRYGLSLTLGGGEVTMLDMMSVYTTLSQMGTKEELTALLKVTDSDGNVLEEYQNQSVQALTPAVAFLVTDVLADNSARTPAFGPNSSLLIPGHTVAVKTGTTDLKRDNWTFGYTPDYVVGVWVGNNDNSPMDPRLTSGITGAAPIWNKIMSGILEGKPDLAFARPEGVADSVVDGRRDLVVSGQTPKTLVRVSRDQDKITLFDAFSSYATSSAITSAKNESTN